MDDLSTKAQHVLGVSKAAYDSNENLRKAYAYLEEHQVQALLDGLMARVVLERPPDLRTYLIELLEEMKVNKMSSASNFFTIEDLSAMFDMWDKLKIGTIPVAKVSETMRALGVDSGAEEETIVGIAGAEAAEIDKDTFINIIRAAMSKCG
mmetsp:Transcript_20646/g.44887  ORF Transcript_20646/g.44887 Transcript_20646/m.44887 type:complete len:151 (-) Transcript_20646:48-500(-)|eukprot:CAMPEP_0206447894 /NCGR_PEP_ID=MMETSP0324_2-20121206/17112_1 /ASSEMBLY_ACC=CAM_ASM_000836 /TAXON_ID=2866 /ORGANISM="Crypthecodinium cohnii, Strain Seligo" /LENGTH=150 /DNA_ID=CAMNT_0053916861 /DNA_START=213 /DNA_END=665 /DNA_ORIENTATION=-